MNLELKQIKPVILIGFLIITCFTSFGQIAPTKYWIQFTDKNNSPFSISTPLDFLSQRAIDRRMKQNIAVIVQDLPVNPSYTLGVQQAANVTVLLSSKWLNGIVIQTTDTFGLANIMNLTFVDSANSRNVQPVSGGSKSTKLALQSSNPPDFKMYASNSVLDYGLAETQARMISVDYIHDLGFTGTGMVIAVLDAGFNGADTTDILQPLFNNNQVLGTWDFVLGEPIDYTLHSDHGKYVLNCMGANLSGRYIGTAPDASYWLLRTEDAPTENIIEEYNWVAGAEFADSVGADVLNTSLGYTTFDDSTMNHTYADMDGNTTVITIGADIAAAKGMIVVNSAGNSGSGEWHYIGAPADGDSVLAIGAVYWDRVLAQFSSRGPSYDGRVKPNVMALGGGVVMPVSSDSVRYINGTSFSGPILAGAAACLWQARPSYSSMEVFYAIQQSADKYTNPDDDYGYGIPSIGMAYYFITGINDHLEQSSSIEAYPNPTTGIVYLPLHSRSETSIRVLNVQGVAVFNQTALNISNTYYELDLSSFPGGIYFIELQTKTALRVVRVVKE